MGTPGERIDFREIVSGADPDENPPHQPHTSVQGPAVVPAIRPSTDMTVLGLLPHYSTLVNYDVSTTTTIKLEAPPGLEQARIEDYFSHSKTASQSIMLSIDQPGPSGLQTDKQKRCKRPGAPSHQAKKAHICQVCQKSFQNGSKLAKHQLSHNGNSPYKCDQCKKPFSSKFKLVRHTLIHSDRKPFSCSVCERTFHRKDHLKNHIKVHNPSKKHYICDKPECGKEYTALLSYKKHRALHAAEEGSLECQFCLKTFASKEEILFHIKIHAGSRTVKSPNEKKFTCDYCDRRFFTRKDVRRHLVVHTGMRDFLCQFCPQRFGRKDHLVRHIKKAHSKKVSTDDMQTQIKVEIKSELSESSMSNPEASGKPEVNNPTETSTFESFPLVPIFEEFESDPLRYLPPESELKDLGSAVLDEIGESSAEAADDLIEPERPELISETDIMRLFEETEETNLPLPGFSQTFQSPPPPQPPPPASP